MSVIIVCITNNTIAWFMPTHPHTLHACPHKLELDFQYRELFKNLLIMTLTVFLNIVNICDGFVCAVIVFVKCQKSLSSHSLVCVYIVLNLI